MSDLWAWAVQAYARSGAEARLLSLQDEHAQCVSYLLWAAWMGRTGRDASRAVIEDGADIARQWDQTVVSPLRAVRRRLRDDDAALHDQVLAAELSAERVLLERLESLAPGPAEAGEPTAALRAAAAAWTPSVSAETIDTLARVLG